MFSSMVRGAEELAGPVLKKRGGKQNKPVWVWRDSAKAKHKWAFSLEAHRIATREHELQQASTVPFCSTLGDDLPLWK